MARTRKVTIRDVAAAAGVSPATVSLVYNDKGDVAADTRAKVLRVGTRLGYRPGWISKVFRSGRTNVIGVAVTHRDTPLWEPTYMPYYRGIIAGAAMEALEHGYSITAIKADRDGELLGPMTPDGVIVVDPTVDDPVALRALERGLTVAAAGGWNGTASHIGTHERLLSVTYALADGVPLALDAMRQRGAKQPAFIRGPVDDVYTCMSQTEYERWCREHRLHPEVFMLQSGQTPIVGARAFLRGALADGYDSVYAINEAYANAVSAAAAEQGLRIPEDLRITAASDGHSVSIDPRLDYLDLDPMNLGAQCARAVIRSLEGETHEDIELPLTMLNRRG